MSIIKCVYLDCRWFSRCVIYRCCTALALRLNVDACGFVESSLSMHAARNFGQLSSSKLPSKRESIPYCFVQQFRVASCLAWSSIKVINKLPKPSATRSDVDVAVIDDYTVIFQVPCKELQLRNRSWACGCSRPAMTWLWPR